MQSSHTPVGISHPGHVPLHSLHFVQQPLALLPTSQGTNSHDHTLCPPQKLPTLLYPFGLLPLGIPVCEHTNLSPSHFEQSNFASPVPLHALQFTMFLVASTLLSLNIIVLSRFRLYVLFSSMKRH